MKKIILSQSHEGNPWEVRSPRGEIDDPQSEIIRFLIFQVIMDQGRQDSDGQQDSGHQYRHESLSGPNHYGQQSTAGEPSRTGFRHLEVYGFYIQVQNYCHEFCKKSTDYSCVEGVMEWFLPSFIIFFCIGLQPTLSDSVFIIFVPAILKSIYHDVLYCKSFCNVYKGLCTPNFFARVRYDHSKSLALCQS